MKSVRRIPLFACLLALVEAIAVAALPGGRPELRDLSFSASMVPDGAAVQSDGKILVFGKFMVSPTTGDATYGVMRILASGIADFAFRTDVLVPVGQSINQVLILGDGRILVSGTFTSIADKPRPGLARLLPDGAVDPSFMPDLAGTVRKTLSLPDGRVYVGGDSGGVKAVYRLAADGKKDLTFPTLTNQELINQDSAGRIYTLSVAPHPVLARHLPDGSRDASYTETTFTPYLSYLGTEQPIERSVITPKGFYGVTADPLRFGFYYTFWRLKPDGGRDDSYQPPPTIATDDYFYQFADGSVFMSRFSYLGNTATFYDTDGRPDPTRYATPRDEAYFYILAVEPDGALLAVMHDGSYSYSFVRMRPIVGRPGRLQNLSARSFVDPSVAPLILGFVGAGDGNTRALVRAIGPALVNYQITDAMSDPRLSLNRDGHEIMTNDQWSAAMSPRFAAVGAFPLDVGGRDAALESDIGAGAYTAVVTSAPGSAPGTALAEVYESADFGAPRHFINASARGPVTANRPLIVGFGIGGEVPVRVLIRCAGPALAKQGVSDPLANPKLVLYRAGNDAPIAENDDWLNSGTITTAVTNTGAFAFDPNSKDSAMLVTLAPGTYSAVATGVNGTSGTALVEVYEAP